jgi:hypothetical protein
VILELLKEYCRVEEAFQGGYENGVQILRKHHSEDMEIVARDIFAHYYISARNKLAIKLIVSGIPLFYIIIMCLCESFNHTLHLYPDFNFLS